MKKTILAIFLALGVSAGTYYLTFAEEVDQPMPIAEEAPSDNQLPEVTSDNMENSYNSGSVGGGSNESDDNQDNENHPADENTDSDNSDDTEDQPAEVENWTIAVSVGAIVVAMLMIVILNIRRRS